MSNGYSVANADSYGWGPDALPDSKKVAVLRQFVIGPAVLDVGCATGTYVDLLAREGFEATGLEAFPEFLHEAAMRGRRGHFVQGQVEKMPFADKAFDTAILFDVLEHVDDHVALREAIRVTRQRLLVLVPLSDPPELLQNNFVFQHHRDRTHLREYSLDDLRRLFEAHRCSIDCIQLAYPVNVRGVFADSLRLPRAVRFATRAALRLAKPLLKPHFSQAFLVIKIPDSDQVAQSAKGAI